jgi:pre-mRNA-splicing factor 18
MVWFRFQLLLDYTVRTTRHHLPLVILTSEMDALLSEINNKRKDLQDPVGSSRANKYMRKGDIEKAREEEERKQRAEEERKKREAREAKEKEKVCDPRCSKSKKAILIYVAVLQNARLNVVRNRTATTSKSPAVGTPGAEDSDAPNKPEAFNISSAECIRRLRAKGEPILLFGETEKERRLRLRALELLEERGGSTAQGQNEFKKFLEEAETGLSIKEEDKKRQPAAKSTKSRDDTADGTPTGAGDDSEEVSAQGSKTVSTTSGEEQVLDLNLVKTDPRKVYPLIYYALKVCHF